MEVSTHGSDQDYNSKHEKPSPAKQLKLDAQRKDAALWTAPKKYPGLTPFSAFAQEFRTKSTISGPKPSLQSYSDLSILKINDAWAAMTPDERLPYLAQFDAQLARYRIEMSAFNARIPLSPLVNIGSAANSNSGSNSDSDFSDTYRDSNSHVCRLVGGSKALLQMEPDQSGPRDSDSDSDELIEPVDVRIFVVCKQIYEEATTVFFGHNRIRIELVGQEYSKLPSPMFRTGFRPTDQALITKLKKIHLELTAGRSCEWALQRVCHELASRARLNEIKVIAHGYTDPGTEADKKVDRLLEILTAIRGVKSVIFDEPVPNDLRTFVDGARGGHRIWILGTAAQRDRVKRIMTTMD
ncbi:MAG: hypothetical protein Q9213_001235 [Squamulea squamosa]